MHMLNTKHPGQILLGLLTCQKLNKYEHICKMRPFGQNFFFCKNVRRDAKSGMTNQHLTDPLKLTSTILPIKRE